MTIDEKLDYIIELLQKNKRKTASYEPYLEGEKKFIASLSGKYTASEIVESLGYEVDRVQLNRIGRYLDSIGIPVVKSNGKKLRVF